jgi:hypothetical protein
VNTDGLDQALCLISSPRLALRVHYAHALLQLLLLLTLAIALPIFRRSHIVVDLGNLRHSDLILHEIALSSVHLLANGAVTATANLTLGRYIRYPILQITTVAGLIRSRIVHLLES